MLNQCSGLTGTVRKSRLRAGLTLISLTVFAPSYAGASPFPREMLSSPTPVDPVVWGLRPTRAATADEMENYYPARAKRGDISGGALINCMITDGGAVDDCSVVKEYPAGQGFGEAGLTLAKLTHWPIANSRGESTIGHRISQKIILTTGR